MGAASARVVEGLGLAVPSSHALIFSTTATMSSCSGTQLRCNDTPTVQRPHRFEELRTVRRAPQPQAFALRYISSCRAVEVSSCHAACGVLYLRQRRARARPRGGGACHSPVQAKL